MLGGRNRGTTVREGVKMASLSSLAFVALVALMLGVVHIRAVETFSYPVWCSDPPSTLTSGNVVMGAGYNGPFPKAQICDIRIDMCARYGRSCGNEAALAYCQYMGLTSVVSSIADADTKSLTAVPANANFTSFGVCNSSGPAARGPCGSFRSITCA